MTRVAVAGTDTDLGRAIIARIIETPGLEFAGGRVTGDIQDMTTLLDGADVLVDVACPDELMLNAINCLSLGCALVASCGTLDPNHVAELHEFAGHIPVFYAPNLCVEAAVVLSLLPVLQDALPHLESEITGVNGHERRPLIPGQELAASQPVAFLSGHGQEILLAQRVHGPDADARGAVRAIQFLTRQGPGFYTMNDLLAAESGVPALARLR